MKETSSVGQEREDVAFAMKGFLIWFLYFAILFIIPTVFKALS